MKFEIDFNQADYYNDNFLINVLGGELIPTNSNKYPPFEIVKIEVRDFEHLREIIEKVDKEFNCFSTALISFNPPTLYIDL